MKKALLILAALALAGCDLPPCVPGRDQGCMDYEPNYYNCAVYGCRVEKLCPDCNDYKYVVNFPRQD